MSFRSRRGKMLHPRRVSFLRYHPCWSRRRHQPKTNMWRGTSDSSAVFCLQSSAGRGTFQTKKRSVKQLAGVNGRECWQQVGHVRQAGNLGHLSFLGLEIDLKRNLHLVLVLILEPSLSSSSVTLQCSECRSQFPPFLLPFPLWFAFCRVQFVPQPGRSWPCVRQTAWTSVLCII